MGLPTVPTLLEVLGAHRPDFYRLARMVYHRYRKGAAREHRSEGNPKQRPLHHLSFSLGAHSFQVIFTFLRPHSRAESRLFPM